MELRDFERKHSSLNIDQRELERKWRVLQEELMLEDLRRKALLGNPAAKVPLCLTTYVECFYVEDGYVD